MMEDENDHESLSIIDVREEDHKKGGHIRTSVNIRCNEIDEKLAQRVVLHLSQTKRFIVLYCMYS